ncbi:Gfo/Idh/MocA family oxidoreductase [bacterium]|nr:Gfo/Idh/MocA family oxidoreductase [bacterium]
MRKKYVLVGTGGRALQMYAKPIASTYADCAQMVGVCDINPLRAEALKHLSSLDCPSYQNFDQMLVETKPDAAIITTVDRYHDEYAVKCLNSGIDVILEKPMAINAEKCKAILDAEKKSGKKVIVTFNYRFTPYVTAIKQAIKDGAIGKILNVDFEYILDTKHGADYFRRWHRKKENSGGLLVHKSTHHFDLINWWIDDEPAEVMAFGTRRFYTSDKQPHGERCMTCNCNGTCEFYLDIKEDPVNDELYFRCESADGYHRDGCIFSDDIDIEDTMSVNVRYAGGVMLSYSLIAHSPYEGFKASINGTDGRLELAEYHSGERASESAYIFDVYDRQGCKTSHHILKSSGGHGGGDEKLRRMIFRGDLPDPLGHMASTYSGAISILIGIAANKSIATGKNVLISDMVDLNKYHAVPANR